MVNICGQCIHQYIAPAECADCSGQPKLVDNFKQKRAPVSLVSTILTQVKKKVPGHNNGKRFFKGMK